MWWMAVLLSCSPVADRGVYRAGPNATAHYYAADGAKVKMWGPAGTVERIGTTAAKGFTLFGESGPLWIVDRDLPAEEKRAPVTAAIAERAGFRMREVLGGTAGTEIDPARSAGVMLRSVLKVRRHLAPPVYVAVATRGQHGVPGPGGSRSPVTTPDDCVGAVAVLDAELATVLDSKLLPFAASTCAVPVAAGPVDLDGNGALDVLVHGQAEQKGFRNWYGIDSSGKLVDGPFDHQEALP